MQGYLAANWLEFTGWKVGAIKKEHSSSHGGCHWIVFTSVLGWLRMKESKETNVCQLAGKNEQWAY